MNPEPGSYDRGAMDERLRETVKRLEMVTTRLEHLPCAQHGAWIGAYRWMFAALSAAVGGMAAWLWSHVSKGG